MLNQGFQLVKGLTAVVALLLFMSFSTFSQTWTGNVSNSWHVPGNWDGNSVPNANATVNIRPVGSNPYPVITQDVTVKQINLSEWSGGGDLRVTNNATLTVTDQFDINNNGHLFLDGGHLVFTGAGNGQRRINMGYTNTLIEVTNGGSLKSTQDRFRLHGEFIVDDGSVELLNGLHINSNKFFSISTGDILIFGETNIEGHFEGGYGNIVFDGNPSNNRHTVTIRGGGRVYMAPSSFDEHPPDCPGHTPDNPPLSGGSIDFYNKSYVENNGRLWGGDAEIIFHKASNAQGDAIIEIHNGNLIFNDDATISNTAHLNVTCKGSVFIEGDGTFQQNGNINVGQGNLTISGDTAFENSGTLNGGDGNISFEGNVTINNNGGVINAENSTITFSGGTFENSGTFDPGTSTFIFAGDGNQQITGSNNTINFYDLIVEDGADVQSSQNVFVINDMVVEEDGFFDVDDGLTINIVGDVTGYPDVDTNRPYIIFLFVIDDTTIKAVFNEALTQATAENTANYRIDDAVFNATQVGTISSASLGGASNNEVTLALNLSNASGIIEQGEAYYLVANNIQNLQGRQVSPNHRKRFGYPDFSSLVLKYYPGGLDRSNLQLWLDAADTRFLFSDVSAKQFASHGDPVAFWADKSGNNRNARQNDENLMPVVNNELAIGGRPSLYFNNVEYLEFDGSFVVGSDYSIASLVARSSSRAFNVYLGGTGTGSNNNLHLLWRMNDRLAHHHWGNDYFATVPPYDGSLEGEIHIMELRQTQSPHRRLFKNGSLLNTRNTSNTINSWDGSAIGRYIDANSPSSFNHRFEGYVSEMIMHNRALTESERIIIENYKAAKWGQALTAASKKFDTPDGFGFQLAGIGRESAADMVAETVYSSGGLGFSNSNPGFLNDNGNYMMAAHNNATGVDGSPYFTNEHILMKWTRTWFVEKTRPGNDGTLTVYFDFADYDLPAPAPGSEYMIIYHPGDPGFPTASTTTLDATSSTEGTRVLFTLSSEDMASGFYTIGKYVAPAVVDPEETTITAVPTIIEADGVSESVITVQARYFTGDPVATGGDNVVLQTTAGVLSSVTDNGDGTYTAVLVSSFSGETAVISGTINGEPIGNTASVVFKTGAADASQTTITADPVYITADGTSTSLITLQTRDKHGNVPAGGGDAVVLTTTAGALSAITDLNNGTYTALLTSETTAQMAIIQGTINAASINDNALVHFVAGPADPSKTTLFAFPETITADGQSTATVIVQTIDAFGNSILTGGDAVTMNATAGSLGPVTDNGDGTYVAILTSSVNMETAFITATINGSEISATASVAFVDHIVLNYYPGGLDNSLLQLWLDAGDPNVLFPDAGGIHPAVAGDRIGHWRDKSIFSRHATQETFAWRPVLDATGGFGQRPSLLFSNAEFLLFDGSFVANTNYTINVVLMRTSGKAYNTYIGGTESGSNNNLHLFWDGHNELHYHHFLNNMDVLVPTFDGNQVGELHMFRFSGADEAPARRVFRNGIFLGSMTSTAALNDWQGASIGRYMPRGGDYFDGRMAEVIMHDYALNNTERIIIGNYTTARWGHPLNPEISFYNTPPNFGQQLVGIGRFSAADFVLETAFTSGGLGFRSTLPGFLAGINNYIMAAHNGETGAASELLLIGDEYINRWQRSWYLQKTVPNGDGLLELYFNKYDYDQSPPGRRDDFLLLYNPDDPGFPASTTVVVDADGIVDGVEIRFVLNSSRLEDGYYTLGHLSRGITYYSRASGSWSNPNTWSLISHTGIAAGQLPGEDDQAIVGASHVVTLVENVTTAAGSILVSNTGTLVTGSNTIEGGGRFILEPGGTLHIGSPDGISASATTGNIQTSVRNFSTQANYVYDGSVLQQTGDGLPAQVNDLRIDNNAGVDAAASLVVNGQLLLDNGLFSMPPGSSLVANSIDKTNGNIRMQLTIDGEKGWRMIASPLATTYDDLLEGFVSQGFIGAGFPDKQPNLLWFDEEEIGTTNMAWRIPGSITESIGGGRGHFLYMFNGAEMSENGQGTGNFYDDVLPVTMDVTGMEHATGGSVFDFGVTHTPRSESNITDTDIPEMNTGWNLLGNPSMATINWDEPAGWTRTNIDNTFYVWDPAANNGNGDFRLWNGTTGTLDNGLIAPFQAFWVRASDSNPVLTMNDAAKTTGGQYVGGGFESKSQTYYIPTALKFKLEADGMETWTVLSFDEDGKVGEDPGDAYRLEPMSDNWLQMYTTTGEHHLPMIINNLPVYFEEPLVIPVYITGQRGHIPVYGEYVLSWSFPENWPLHWDVTLMDHAEKTAIPLDGPVQSLEFMLNHSGKSTASEHTGSQPPAMPQSIVTAGHATYGGAGETPGRSANGDEIEPKTTSVEAAPSFSIVIHPNPLPEEIAYMAPQAELLPVYPNPVSETATIRFSLPEAGDVRIDVFDIYGRHVENLVNGWFGTGIYTLKWSSKTSTSGIYFVVLQSGSSRSAVKMIVY
jgi:hypothetical protein